MSYLQTNGCHCVLKVLFYRQHWGMAVDDIALLTSKQFKKAAGAVANTSLMTRSLDVCLCPQRDVFESNGRFLTTVGMFPTFSDFLPIYTSDKDGFIFPPALPSNRNCSFFDFSVCFAYFPFIVSTSSKGVLNVHQPSFVFPCFYPACSLAVTG
jgi:hypothetical protein